MRAAEHLEDVLSSGSCGFSFMRRSSTEVQAHNFARCCVHAH